ncbi:MAG: hypothetical protein ACYTHK_04215 [Planctomycetota bacterium]
MRRWTVCLLLLAAFAPAERLDGEIKSGKAKKLVEKAKPILKQAFELRKKLLFAEETESDAYRAMIKKCIELYDKGSMLLVEALEIRYDPGVNNMLLRASRDLAKSRAALFQFDNRRRWLEEQKKKEEAKPEEPKKPQPVEEEMPEPPPPPRFEEHAPPALPGDVTPRAKRTGVSYSESDWLRSEKKGIEKRIKDYYGARRKGRLTTRCKLCAGKGHLKGGTSCETCAGSGAQINLFYFRKAFWNGFTPVFREAPGALDSLRKFLEHARGNPESLGEKIATFQVLDIEPQLDWARVRVRVKTETGERVERVTLVSIGSAWYFFCPATDEELIWTP